MKHLFPILLALALLLPVSALAGNFSTSTCCAVVDYTAGNGFIWMSDGTDLSDYTTGVTGGYRITLADSSGNWAKADVGNAGSGVSTESANLYDAGAGVFTAGTYSWTAYGTNALANDANTLKITGDGSDLKGAYQYLRDSFDLNSDLTVKAAYRFRLDGKSDVGDSIDILIYDGVSAVLYNPTLNVGVFSELSVYFSAVDATSTLVRFGGVGNGEIGWIDNLGLYRILTPGATGLYVTNWDIDAGFDYNDSSGYTVTIKKAGGGGVRSRVNRRMRSR